MAESTWLKVDLFLRHSMVFYQKDGELNKKNFTNVSLILHQGPKNLKNPKTIKITSVTVAKSVKTISHAKISPNYPNKSTIFPCNTIRAFIFQFSKNQNNFPTITKHYRSTKNKNYAKVKPRNLAPFCMEIDIFCIYLILQKPTLFP